MTFRQARWDEPPIWELAPPTPPVASDPIPGIPDRLRRKEPLHWPELSELEVVRHYTRLSQMNFGIDTSVYPLGSCTMKYNPKVSEALARRRTAAELHPNQPEATVQGALELMWRLERALAKITGYPEVSLQPGAGAHGEHAALLMVRAYFRGRGEEGTRTEVLLPDTAHGTNPASAAMAGFTTHEIPSQRRLRGSGAVAGGRFGPDGGLHADQSEHRGPLRVRDPRDRRNGARRRWPPLLRWREPQRDFGGHESRTHGL